MSQNMIPEPISEKNGASLEIKIRLENSKNYKLRNEARAEVNFEDASKSK